MSRRDPTLWSPDGDDPPDWALPSWDSLPPDEPTSRPGRPVSPPASPAAAPGASFSRPVPSVIPDELRPTILGVSEVTRVVRDAVRADDRLRDVWVEGEVGRVTISSAGHAYFTLKDERSQLSCIWFRDDRLTSPFEPRTGLRVVAHGRIDVFDQQGVYQLYVTAVQPAGFGDLALRFEELKARLAAEGLFDAARKRPLPVRPAVIAVATSASGAVWHDIRHVLERRWPLARVVFAAVPGPGRAGAGRASSRRSAGSPATPTSAWRPAARRTRRGHDPGPRRWLARGPLVVQRRAGRAGDRRPPAAPRVRRRPRDRRDPGRLRRRRPGADAVRRRRARRARPGPRSRRPGGRAPAPDRGRPGGSSSRPAASSTPNAGPSTACGRRQRLRPGPRARRGAARSRDADRRWTGSPVHAALSSGQRRASGRSSPCALGRPTRRSTPARRRLPSSARRRPSTAATRSSGAAPTGGSCAGRTRRRGHRPHHPPRRGRARRHIDRPRRVSMSDLAG